MIEDIPVWLNINIWQWSRHQAEYSPPATREMDRQVRRYMDGEIGAVQAARNCESTPKRVEARAEILMIAAMGRIG